MTRTRPLPYEDGSTHLDGVLVWPGTADGPHPGLDDHAREQAGRYAELGYTVLAADMFGAGISVG